ncbi:carbohydrate kinase family protein [Patescibacteria group bacterium]|nr:carbohydrate kinase family protein [Patescibacteria group bacterium]
MFNVISLGTATLDVFLRSTGLDVETQNGEKDICVSYGAKIEVNEINFESGGGGTNSAVTFARQGLKVASIVQIGDDFAGEKILTDLKKEGVDAGFVDIQKDNYTDYSTVLWVRDGGRTILIYRGKTKLEKASIPWESLETKWFYLSSLEGNLEIVKEIISRFPQSKIAWNPGSRELNQKEEVLSLLPQITQLNANKEEMEQLVNEGKPTEIKELLTLLQKLPCQYLVVTDDRRGSWVWEKEEAAWWHAGIYEKAPRLETTGAGDSFGSGLVVGLIKEQNIEDCLHLASANATSVVGQVGAKRGILRESELVNWTKEELQIKKIF